MDLTMNETKMINESLMKSFKQEVAECSVCKGISKQIQEVSAFKVDINTEMLYLSQTAVEKANQMVAMYASSLPEDYLQ